MTAALTPPHHQDWPLQSSLNPSKSLGAASPHAAQWGPPCYFLAECFLVQPGMLHLLPHPQHHLRHQAHQTLPPHPQPAHVRGGHGVGRWAAWCGRMQGGEMWAPPRPPDVFLLLLLQLYRFRGDLSLPHPPCHSAQALGRGVCRVWRRALHPRSSHQTVPKHCWALGASNVLQGSSSF